MNKYVKRLVEVALLVLVSTNVLSQESSLVGTWQSKDPELTVTFSADGTGTLAGAPIKYLVRGNQLSVDDQGAINHYTFRLQGDMLTVSGANLEAPITFARQRAATGFARGTTKPVEMQPKQKGIAGRWQSSEATVEIKADGTLTLNGTPFQYVIKGNVITIGNEDGIMQFPFQLDGDTLNVQVDGRTVVYKRITGDEAGSAMPAGANPQELLGKWCYMSNVNSSSGGRMSNRCFTLYPNGTYEFYAETSSSGPIASSASQESDSGTWTATATTITRHSRSQGTATYSLEKRNHPKTGDPMLVLDGDAYVTYGPRQPW